MTESAASSSGSPEPLTMEKLQWLIRGVNERKGPATEWTSISLHPDARQAFLLAINDWLRRYQVQVDEAEISNIGPASLCGIPLRDNLLLPLDIALLENASEFGVWKFGSRNIFKMQKIIPGVLSRAGWFLPSDPFIAR